jgi:hypothetical protein
VFGTTIYFYSSLLFAGKARNLPLVWGHIRGATLVGSILAHKYYTRVEVNGSGNETTIYFYSSLIFAGKARNLPLVWGHIRGSILVDSSLAHKY